MGKRFKRCSVLAAILYGTKLTHAKRDDNINEIKIITKTHGNRKSGRGRGRRGGRGKTATVAKMLRKKKFYCDCAIFMRRCLTTSVAVRL